MNLLPIMRGGIIDDELGELPDGAQGVLEATAALYDSAGFFVPWICYIATQDGRPVGTCGFKSAPVNGRVEIAYFTFPGFEGRGIATSMAACLLALAARGDSAATVAAQTLPGRNASHRVLEKLGFACIGEIDHPEDGRVLEWRRNVHNVSRR